ncbi:hypothetical protein DFH09DRAFT_1121355, partial [Mycena vulgaris]
PVLKCSQYRGGQFKHSIDLTGAHIGQQPPSANDEDHDYRHAFLVSSPPHGSHIFCADSVEEKNEWVKILTSYVTGSYKDGASNLGGSEIYWNLTFKDPVSTRKVLYRRNRKDFDITASCQESL